MSYETNKLDWTLYGEERERLVGVKKLIAAFIKASVVDDVIFEQAKAQYGDYFTDDELKEFIDEAKDRTVQEA